MTDPVSILLAGNGSHLNRGCQAIDLGTAAVLGEAFGQVELIAAPYDLRGADWTGRPIRLLDPPAEGVRWSPRWVAERVATRLPAEVATRFFARRWSSLAAASSRVACSLVVGGDTHTLDYGRPDRFWGIDRAARGGGRPLVMWGATIGPFAADPAYERFCAAELSGMAAVFARDDHTASYVARIAPGVPVVRASDPAFALDPSEPLIDVGVAEGAIGINLSPLIGILSGESAGAWLDRATDLASEIARLSDRQVVLVGHVFLPGNDDHAFLTAVGERLASRGIEAVVAPRELSAPEIKWVVGRLHSFIGARTHATIAAMSMGVPTVSVAYSVKARGVNRDLVGHDEWVVDGSGLTPEALGGAWQRVDREHQTVATALTAAAAAARARAFGAGAALRELLERGAAVAEVGR